MSAINTSWYPKPLDMFKSPNDIYDTGRIAMGYGVLTILSIPVIGNLAAKSLRLGMAKDADLNGQSPLTTYVSNEVSKCERMGALILMVVGIALLAIFPKFGQNFAIAGGTILGIGTLEAAYFSYRIKKRTEAEFEYCWKPCIPAYFPKRDKV